MPIGMGGPRAQLPSWLLQYLTQNQLLGQPGTPPSPPGIAPPVLGPNDQNAGQQNQQLMQSMGMNPQIAQMNDWLSQLTQQRRSQMPPVRQAPPTPPAGPGQSGLDRKDAIMAMMFSLMGGPFGRGENGGGPGFSRLFKSYLTKKDPERYGGGQ